MRLFVLRATKTETYDCPDNGLTNICDRYEDVQFATEPEALTAMAKDLNKGHVGYWSEKRAKELRKLHSDYDDGYTYAVHDVSNLFTEEAA